MDELTPKEAARILGRSPAYVIRLAERGELAGRRIGPESRGGRWLIDRASVAALQVRWETHPPQPGRRPVSDPSPTTVAKRRSRTRATKSEGVPV